MISDGRAMRTRDTVHAFFWFVMILLFLLTIGPIIWTFFTSIKTPLDALSIPPTWIFEPTLKNYSRVFAKAGFVKAFINTLIIAGGTTALTIFVGSLCAYATTRYRFLRFVPYLILLTRLFPPTALVIPYFLIFRQLHLVDTHLGVIISHASFSLPFVVWLMRSFFLSLPVELEEASLIDGCNRLQALYKIILPLSLPGLTATSIYTFIGSWNDFFFALILTRVNAKTLPIVASAFVTDRGVMWGEVNAISILILLPVIVFVFIAEKGMLKGLVSGAIK